MRLIHYTNLEALVSIIETQTLRLTDARYLNDTQEMKEGFDYIGKQIKLSEYAQSTDKYLKQAHRIFENEFNNFATFSEREEPAFLCSFSSSSDLLSQWRSYGMFAIEFEPTYIQYSNFNILECKYTDEDKERLAQERVSQAICEIAQLVSLGEFGENYLAVIDEVQKFNASLKHMSFHEEKEFRHVESVSANSQNIKFRADNNLLKPYIDKSFCLESVKAIHVGPVKEKYQTQKALERLIGIRRDYENTNIEHEIPVICSEIPFQ